MYFSSKLRHFFYMMILQLTILKCVVLKKNYKLHFYMLLTDKRE